MKTNHHLNLMENTLTEQQEPPIYPILQIDKILLNLRQLQQYLYHSVHRHALNPPARVRNGVDTSSNIGKNSTKY